MAPSSHAWDITAGEHYSHLGKPTATELDESFGNLRKAFDPSLLLGKCVANYWITFTSINYISFSWGFKWKS